MRKFDEMYEQLPASGVGGPVRAHYQAYAQWLSQQSAAVMASRREEAEMIFRRVGIISQETRSILRFFCVDRQGGNQFRLLLQAAL